MPVIVTNFAAFPRQWTSAGGQSGTTYVAKDADEFWTHSASDDAVCLINAQARILFPLVARGAAPFARPRRVAVVDFQFRRPTTLASRLKTKVKELVLHRVDLFINYFRDTTAMERVYGIDRQRTAFVPFKANLWKYRTPEPRPDGRYVLCFGRSLRDYDSFLSAMDLTGLPGVIVDPRQSGAFEHGSVFTRALDALPQNVVLAPHDNSNESQAALLADAAIVAVPIIRGALTSGISTILNAMALGKCVIATEGVGVSDVFVDELLTVPVADPVALAAAIQRAWQDHALRETTARLGWRYALQCGSEQAMFQRIIDCLESRGLLAPALPATADGGMAVSRSF